MHRTMVRHELVVRLDAEGMLEIHEQEAVNPATASVATDKATSSQQDADQSDSKHLYIMCSLKMIVQLLKKRK